jgi:hypothetical protein
VQLPGKLAALDPAMTARQWAAGSGLDPVELTSGSEVRKPARISRQGNRHLRRALSMPALAATVPGAAARPAGQALEKIYAIHGKFFVLRHFVLPIGFTFVELTRMTRSA